MDYPRRILLVGNGGRECALANALLLNQRVEQLLLAPANCGVIDPHTTGRVSALEIKAEATADIVAAALRERIQLAVIGPEAPLVAGLADELRRQNIPAVGPGAAAARLEGSKAFAKQFMLKYGIPTAHYEAFDAEDREALLDYLQRQPLPLVLKADGLAAGKGVFVCHTHDELDAAYVRLIEAREFGAAAERIIVEEALSGPEISFTCLVTSGLETGCHGVLLQASSDYKRLLDGDQGPNTGGMGNICPSPWASEEIVREFHEEILDRVLDGLIAEGLEYRGFLFVGTMLTDAGLKVLEFNVRLGDPEAQVVLPLTPLSDWAGACNMLAQGAMPQIAFMRRHGACVAVVLASAGYPQRKSAAAVIEGLDRVAARGLLAPEPGPNGTLLPPAVSLYFAGVAREPRPAAPAVGDAAQMQAVLPFVDAAQTATYLASGGRVLAVSAQGQDLSDARRIAYEVVGNLRFKGMQFRSDIGKLH